MTVALSLLWLHLRHLRAFGHLGWSEFEWRVFLSASAAIVLLALMVPVHPIAHWIASEWRKPAEAWAKVLVLIGIVLAVLQITLAWQSNRNIARIERARVQVLGTQIEFSKYETTLWITVRNAGRTQANRVSIRPWLSINQPVGSWNGDQLWAAETITIPGDSTVQVPFRITKLDPARDQEVAVHGEASYWDEFGNYHAEQFWFAGQAPFDTFRRAWAVSGFLGEMKGEAEARQRTLDQQSLSRGPEHPLGVGVEPASPAIAPDERQSDRLRQSEIEQRREQGDTKPPGPN